MIISEEILQNLCCSNCKKYLSIPPIKAYPNRQVKCGRCCGEDDGGTKSLLYEMVTKDLEFPCINHMEGCPVQLPMSEMANHEAKCQGQEYCCPICPYTGYSFNLRLHIINQHERLLLRNKEFFVDLDKEFQESTFFYFDVGLLIYLTARYESSDQQLTFTINSAQKGEQQTMNCKFFVYSIENKLTFKTDNLPCSKWGPLRQFFKVRIALKYYPKKIAVCQFEINKEPLLSLSPKVPSVLDSSVDTALLKYTFNNISEMVLDSYVYATVPSYGVKNIPWKVFISKVSEDNQNFLSVYLEKNKDTPDCYITAKFILLNVNEKYNIVRAFKRRCIKHGLGFNRFLKFDGILNPKYGFIENDSIKVDALLKVELVEDEEDEGGEECTSCKRKYTSDESINVSAKMIKREN